MKSQARVASQKKIRNQCYTRNFVFKKRMNDDTLLLPKDQTENNVYIS